MAKKRVSTKKRAQGKPGKARTGANASSDTSNTCNLDIIRVEHHQTDVFNPQLSVPRSPPILGTPEPANQPSPEHEDSAITILNILDKSYELSTETYLNSERIISKHRFVKLSAFRFQPFLAESIKLITQRTETPSEIIKWNKGEAVLQNSRLSKHNHPHSDVFDDEDWQNVENIVKEWMLASRPGIRVDLRFYFTTPMSSTTLEPKIPENMPLGMCFDASSNLNSKIAKAPRVFYLEVTFLMKYRVQRHSNTLMI